ncbi:MAG: SusC/RagA family TonB-linked outer membrane protein [Bacteroidales bacterium]
MIIKANRTSGGLAFIVMFLLMLSQLHGQRNINGTITSVLENEPLPGATVIEKGTSNGVVTDNDGTYDIMVSDADAVLVFSFVGYLKQEVPVGNRSVLDVSLEQDLMNMEEVVVMAYSEKSRTEISSSVVSLSADEIDQVTVNSVADMLVGKVAGVQVQSASGQPGEAGDIRIRGVGSIFSPQTPLIVVDGIIGGSYNPNDIENISVLKDAGATGLYGSAAAAGVILITTKSGKPGQSEIKARIRRGIKIPQFGNFQMMNTQQLYDYHQSLYSPSLFPTARPESLLNNEYDWINNSYRSSNITTVNVSASGSDEKTNYYLAVDYMDDEGTLRGTSYDRLSLRSNVKYKLNDRVDIGTNITFNYGNSNYAHWNMAEGVYRLQPWDLPVDSEGEIVYDVADAGWLSNVVSNPYHSELYNKIGGYGLDGAANVTLRIRIFDWLKFDSWTSAGMGYGKSETIYSPKSFEGVSDGGRMSNNIYLDRSFGNTSLLKFDKTFGSHSIDGLIGGEIGSYRSERGFGGEAIGFLHGQVVPGVAGQQGAPSGIIVESRSVSLLSQLNYNFNKKYFATVSYRRDGNSRFAPANKFANFFTYAASWLVSSEDFIKEINSIHYLKLRASYGEVGNSTFPSGSFYPYFPSFTAAGIYNGQSSYFPDLPGNYDLTWETSRPLNLGIDIGLFNRVEFNVDFYDTRTEDLLFRNPLPSSKGYEFQWANVGEIQNTGVELAVSGAIIKNKDLTWNINFNISSNTNKLRALSDKESVEEMVISRGVVSQILLVDGGAFDWYMPKWLGVDPDNGDPLWEDIIYDENGKEIDRVATNNYNVAAQDYQVMGSPFPDFAGGFGTFLSYKGFSLNASFSYSVGNMIYHSSRQEYDNDGENVSVNSLVLLDGWSRWENPGDDATHPEPVYGGNKNSNKYSSRYLEDGSYLRLRNLTLGYDLPSALVRKINVHGLRINLTMDNLFTLTKYSGPDPDVPLYIGDWQLPGTQSFKYPINKQFLVGLEFSF